MNDLPEAPHPASSDVLDFGWDAPASEPGARRSREELLAIGHQVLDGMHQLRDHV
ncbi:hypothetical protein [Cellulomonas massiliensis]|uniref:hypothetical protein n=1 Tax=Cellulomonas massiliensis TaxID=1465811 RepID=UPI0003034B81|nr:hypothetical protein [Cellulomonas massiliensis]